VAPAGLEECLQHNTPSLGISLTRCYEEKEVIFILNLEYQTSNDNSRCDAILVDKIQSGSIGIEELLWIF